jgi:hypothetical protein
VYQFAKLRPVFPAAVQIRFYRIIPPRRWVMDEAAFANMVDEVHAHGLGPAYGKVVDAVYYGHKRGLAKWRDWIHGWSLKQLLQNPDVAPHKMEAVFRMVGTSLAKFHLLIKDPRFYEHHVAESDGSPWKPRLESRTFYLFEKWRRDALLAASCSTTNKRLERIKTNKILKEWNWSYDVLWNANIDIEFLKRICCNRWVPRLGIR